MCLDHFPLLCVCVCVLTVGQGHSGGKECACWKEMRGWLISALSVPAGLLDMPQRCDCDDETEEKRRRTIETVEIPFQDAFQQISRPVAPARHFDEPLSGLPGIVARPQTQKQSQR